LFLFLGLDSCDLKLAKEFEHFEDLPFDLKPLEQDIPQVISKRGQKMEYTGWWTFYIWGAILSGQIMTPEMEQKHPTPNDVEFPDWKKNTKVWLKNRLKRKPRYDSFAWEDFDRVKIINYPIHLPEARKNCAFFSDKSNKTSREYNSELEMMKMEINEAILHDYDACFVATRFLDCMSHSASHPKNHGHENLDSWVKESIDMSFEEFHGEGAEFDKLTPSDNLQDLEKKESSDKMANEIINHVSHSYEFLAEILKQIYWSKIDNYMVVSDHGFNFLGSGSVRAHSERAVFDSNFCDFRVMSNLIRHWRSDLLEQVC